MTDEKCEDGYITLEALGKPWRPDPIDPKGKRRFDSYDPACFGSATTNLTDSDLDSILSVSAPWELKSKERDALREKLTQHITRFQTLRFRQGRPSASEFRERLESVETAMRKALTRLGIETDPDVVLARGAYSHELNPNILNSLIIAAGGDHKLVTCAVTALAGLAHWAKRAQPSSKTGKEVDFARIFTIQNLAVTYSRTFETKPSATRGGPWLKFLRAVFELAGEQSTTLTDDALKNAWAHAKALPSMPKLPW